MRTKTRTAKSRNRKSVSIRILEEHLEAAGIPTHKWGKGRAKTTKDLLREIARGESILRFSPPQRQVRVAQPVIKLGGRILLEHKQIMKDGRIRIKNTPPAEKMKPGESIKDAILRCLREELGVTGLRVKSIALRSPSNGITVKKESFSYPGLPTIFRFFLADVIVEGLPLKPFSTKEVASPNDPVAGHRWIWRKPSEAKNWRSA